ncbi:hypothetical protein K438DRAFT_1869296 [Mycena galopus ATCC 62051]|nr:hypothetical protein K438DRAFT_1869296 [Mycena galopus ATCC 62051]
MNNFGSYTNSIDPTLIPTTILDAITVTHKLGLRYLWVDSFCEIPKIHSVFRNAFLTIVAAKAEKSSTGFLHSKRSRRVMLDSIGTMLLSEMNRSPPEPIDERAWCLEERVLSPRVLVYGRSALQYECQTNRINVNGSHNFLPTPTEQPRLPDFVFARGLHENLAHPSDKEKNDSWSRLLGQYSKRVVTKPRDRLVALGALSRQFHLLWPNSEYVARLWTHQLPQALLWYTATSSNGGDSLRPEKYRAPSWSWASVDNAIQFADGLDTPTNNICEIISVKVTLKNSADPYGQVVSGFLTLSVILITTVVWNVSEGTLYERSDAPGRIKRSSHPDSEQGEIGYTVADATEEVSEVALAVVRDQGRSLLGLCLVSISECGHDDCMGVYRRVGWFAAPFCDKDRWVSVPRRVIRIM